MQNKTITTMKKLIIFGICRETFDTKDINLRRQSLLYCTNKQNLTTQENTQLIKLTPQLK